MTSYRHVTEIREHMFEIRKCCNVWPMFVRLKLGLKMLHLVFLAEPCLNSFDRTSSLVLRYSIVLSLYKCNTTRMVGRNRTTRAQYTSLQIKKKNKTIKKQIHIRISLKPLIYQDILHLI